MKYIMIALSMAFVLTAHSALVGTTRIEGTVKSYSEQKVKICTKDAGTRNCFDVPRASIDPSAYRLETGKTVVAYVNTKDFLIEAFNGSKK